MRIKTIITACFILALFQQSVLADEVESGSSFPTGGAGGEEESLTCPNGKRITGLKAFYGEYIDRISLRCTRITSDGKWGNNGHSWTSFSSSDAIPPANHSKTITCNADHFAFEVGLNVSIGTGVTSDVVHNIVLTTGVIAGIRLHCTQSMLGGIPKLVPESDGFPSITTRWTDIIRGERIAVGQDRDKKCPAGLAHGVLLSRGWHIDTLALNCKIGSPGWSSSFATGTTASTVFPPTLISPSSLEPDMDIDFLFEKSSNAGVYLYELSIGQANKDNWFYNEIHTLSTPPSSTISIPITIPPQYSDMRLKWRVRGCNASLCSQRSSLGFEVMLAPPELIKPGGNALLSPTRSIDFDWNPLKYGIGMADRRVEGYYLYVWKASSPPPQTKQSTSGAAAESDVHYTIQRISHGDKLDDFPIPLSFGNQLRWSVSACTESNKCSDMAPSRVINLGSPSSLEPISAISSEVVGLANYDNDTSESDVEILETPSSLASLVSSPETGFSTHTNDTSLSGVTINNNDTSKTENPTTPTIILFSQQLSLQGVVDGDNEKPNLGFTRPTTEITLLRVVPLRNNANDPFNDRSLPTAIAKARIHSFTPTIVTPGGGGGVITPPGGGAAPPPLTLPPIGACPVNTILTSVGTGLPYGEIPKVSIGIIPFLAYSFVPPSDVALNINIVNSGNNQEGVVTLGAGFTYLSGSPLGTVTEGSDLLYSVRRSSDGFEFEIRFTFSVAPVSGATGIILQTLSGRICVAGGGGPVA